MPQLKPLNNRIGARTSQRKPTRRDLFDQLLRSAASIGALSLLGGRWAIAQTTQAEQAAPEQSQPSAAAGAAVPAFSTAKPGAAAAAGWAHQTLPKVAKANSFALVADGGSTVLQIRSAGSASSWITALDGAPGTPASNQPGASPAVRRIAPARAQLQWRWKVSNSVNGSSVLRKEGDDYAARLYVLFDLPPERLSLRDRLRLDAARLLSGQDIPSAALCYVWGDSDAVGTQAPNPYTDRVRMVVLDSGAAQAGQWRRHQRDLRADWAANFGGEMPPLKGLAVSADTDNTGGQVEAWFGDITLNSRT